MIGAIMAKVRGSRHTSGSSHSSCGNTVKGAMQTRRPGQDMVDAVWIAGATVRLHFGHRMQSRQRWTRRRHFQEIMQHRRQHVGLRGFTGILRVRRLALQIRTRSRDCDIDYTRKTPPILGFQREPISGSL